MKTDYTVGGLMILVIAAYLGFPAVVEWIITIAFFGVGALCIGVVIHAMFTGRKDASSQKLTA